MKTLAVIFYIIGCGLLIASCFTDVVLTWWLGGAAVVALIAGCIFQYNSSSGNRERRRSDEY